MKTLFRRLSTLFSIMLMCLLLTGCPYSSSVPIDEGTVMVPKGFEGKWISSSEIGSDSFTYYLIKKTDNFHATAQKMEFTSSDSTYEETIYHLTFSDVKGDTFMNAIEKDGTDYYLYKFRIDLQSGEVYLSEVTDYIKEKFSNSKDLKDFIAKNKSNSYFYTNGSETYVHH